MRCLQGSFGQLKLPTPANDVSYRYRLLEVCCRLHKLQTREEGINQIKVVYEGIRKGSGLYTEFGELLLKDIKRMTELDATTTLYLKFIRVFVLHPTKLA